MSPVLMHVDTLYLFAVEVASDMGAFVNDKALLPGFGSHVSEGRAEKSGSDNEVVVEFKVIGLHYFRIYFSVDNGLRMSRFYL